MPAQVRATYKCVSATLCYSRTPPDRQQQQQPPPERAALRPFLLALPATCFALAGFGDAAVAACPAGCSSTV